MLQAKERFGRYLQRRYGDRSTPKHYLSDLQRFIQHVGAKPPQHITTADIDQFVEQQMAAGLQPATINRRLSTLHSFFEFLASDEPDQAWANPVNGQRHRIKQGQTLPRDASETEVARLFAVIDDPRDRAMFGLMVGSGLRVGEVASLQCTNLEVPTSSEQSARLRVLGKGRKERLVWVTPRWYGVVQAWLAQRPVAETDHLFLNQHGRPLSVAGIQYRFKRYCQQAGVYLTCHQLRHTFARRLADERMPTESIAQLLGHVQVETTKRYTAGANPDLREAFLQTMASIEETPSLTPPAELAFPRPRPQPERANSQALERTIGRLADMPEWLQPLLAAYLRYRWRNWSAHTAALNARVLSSKLKSPWRWFITHRQLKSLADLQRSDLEAWLEARAAAGISPASRAIDLSQLHACLRFAQERGLPVSANVFRVAAPIRPAALPRYLTPEAYQQLVTTVYEETVSDTPRSILDRAWFLTLAHTGVRISELLNLRVGDVDFATRRLFIRGSKNGHERVVYLTNALTRTLTHYLTYRSVTADDHLWIVNGKPLSDHQVRYRWHRWREACGVQATPHQLRHTLATQLINNGMPLTSVAKLLGHRSLSSTQHYARLYEHTVKIQFDKAVEKIEGIAAVQWPSSSPESVESLEHIVDSV